MDRLSDLLNGVSFLGWSWLGLAVGVSLATELWPHIRYRWGDRRLAKRIAFDREIHRDELRELIDARGEEPDRIDWVGASRRILATTFEVAIPVWLADALLDDPLILVVIMTFMFPLLMNKRSPEERLEVDPRPNVYPREAKIGLAFAVALTLGILLFISTAL